ncbi:COP9 signalosome complex subunit 3 [Thoreauomyces humboldtii]|nr:COP9 signalosome complex subunit 3 [Thoreauomyces humboldtii]
MDSVGNMDGFLRMALETENWKTGKNDAGQTELLQTKHDVLLQPTSDGRDPLSLLNPSLHTVPCLLLLNARLSASHSNLRNLFQHATTFVTRFRPDDLQHVASLMTAFAEGVANQAERARNPILAVGILKIACERWSHVKEQSDRSGSGSAVQLTSIHALLCKMCLLARTPRAALDILLTPITEIQPANYDLQYQHYLLYHYYGGMIFAQLKKFDQALDFWSLCISAPGPNASAIQVEAYRKYLLVGVVLRNRVLPIPAHTGAATVRACNKHAVAYRKFAEACLSPMAAGGRLETEYNSNERAFADHRNAGLAVQCLQSRTRRIVQGLTETYSTISLTDVARACDMVVQGFGPDVARAEDLVCRMIGEGQVHAKIDFRDDQMVAFHDPPERYVDGDTARLLDVEIAKAMKLSAEIVTMERGIATSKDFASRSGGGGSGGSGMSSSIIDDEMFDGAGW